MTSFLGIDTSNYTTSAACCRADGSGYNSSQLLTVKSGELGLRQNEALFQHIKNLPQRFAELREAGFLQDIAAVGRRRPAQGGGRVLYALFPGWGVSGTHPGGDFGRALLRLLSPAGAYCRRLLGSRRRSWSCSTQPMLAWHLSGGTTELLLVVPENGNVRAARIGGTTDISAGQLIDRTGQYLHLDFPAGKALDKLAAQSDKKERFRVRMDSLQFSFSGIENKVQKQVAQHKGTGGHRPLHPGDHRFPGASGH